jgi:hypothetical protein
MAARTGQSPQGELFTTDRGGRTNTPSRCITDRPRALNTRECADFFGKELDFVYELIESGTLKARYVVMPGKKRGTYVISQEDFVRCLRKLKWSRIPKIG